MLGLKFKQRRDGEGTQLKESIGGIKHMGGRNSGLVKNNEVVRRMMETHYFVN